MTSPKPKSHQPPIEPLLVFDVQLVLNAAPEELNSMTGSRQINGACWVTSGTAKRAWMKKLLLSLLASIRRSVELYLGRLTGWVHYLTPHDNVNYPSLCQPMLASSTLTDRGTNLPLATL